MLRRLVNLLDDDVNWAIAAFLILLILLSDVNDDMALDNRNRMVQDTARRTVVAVAGLETIILCHTMLFKI